MSVETLSDTPWTECAIGRDRTLVRTLDSATMAFGLGPARGSAKDPARITAIADDRLVELRHCRQIHGREIHTVHPGGERVAEIGPGDGLVTSSFEVGLLVWTADCVPILLSGNGVVAALHSGWRGCAADIVGAAIDRINRDFEVSPEKIHAALGPAVCGGCYEVGPEVPEALDRFGLDESRWLAEDYVDLRGFLTARLEGLGVPAGNIETVGGCTAESPELASFRRDGETAGRQWSMVYLNTPASPGAGP